VKTIYQGKISGLEIIISEAEYGFFAKTFLKNDFEGSVKKNGKATIISSPLPKGSPIEFDCNSPEELNSMLINIGHSTEDIRTLFDALLSI
ncbi:hypothetical protein KA996_12745, partial [bacterium]|nr:hypothetical protein [bacterium]